MKTLVAAVLASAVSFGAFAQTPAPAMGASAPMMKSDSMMKKDTMSDKKMMKKHTTKKKMMKGASAPAA